MTPNSVLEGAETGLQTPVSAQMPSTGVILASAQGQGQAHAAMGSAEREAARQFAFSFGAAAGAAGSAAVAGLQPGTGAACAFAMQQVAPSPAPRQPGCVLSPTAVCATPAFGLVRQQQQQLGAVAPSPVTALAQFMAGSPFSLQSAQRRPVTGSSWPMAAATPLAPSQQQQQQQQQLAPPPVPMDTRPRGRSASERSPSKRSERSAKRRACDSLCSPPPVAPRRPALAAASSPSRQVAAFGGCPFADGPPGSEEQDAAVAFSRQAVPPDATPGRQAMAAAALEHAKIGLVSPSFCPLNGAVRPILPTVPHDDLHSIDVHTLARLLHEPTAWGISSFFVVDCRYPFEHQGGCVRGAINLWRTEDVDEYFIGNRPTPTLPESQDSRLRPAIIFHCEYSSARAPKLCRHLRNMDRNVHAMEYPALAFPHLFLLKGGYRDFFAAYPQLCTPQTYVSMHDPAYAEDLRNVHSEMRAQEMKQRRKSGGRMSGGGGVGGAGISPRNLLEPRTLALY